MFLRSTQIAGALQEKTQFDEALAALRHADQVGDNSTASPTGLPGHIAMPQMPECRCLCQKLHSRMPRGLGDCTLIQAPPEAQPQSSVPCLFLQGLAMEVLDRLLARPISGPAGAWVARSVRSTARGGPIMLPPSSRADMRVRIRRCVVRHGFLAAFGSTSIYLNSLREPQHSRGPAILKEPRRPTDDGHSACKHLDSLLSVSSDASCSHRSDGCYPVCLIFNFFSCQIMVFVINNI